MEDCITEMVEDCSGEIDDYYSDEDDSYIEIELDAAAPAPTCNNYNDDDDGEEEGEEHNKLRISISSSTISIPLLLRDPDIIIVQKENTDQNTIISNSSVEFPVQYNETVLSGEFRQTPDAQTKLRANRVIPCDNVDFLCARKQPSMATTTTNGVMMKLMIKFGGINMRALFASLVKPRKPSQANNIHNKPRKKSKSAFFQCYQKWLVKSSKREEQAGRKNKKWDFENEIDSISISGSFRSSKKPNRVNMEMELGTIRGIFNAIGMNISQRGRSSSKRSNYSCESTPIHEGFSSNSENSILAAIAYCKSSFGQTHDLSFRSSISSSTNSGFVACSDQLR